MYKEVLIQLQDPWHSNEPWPSKKVIYIYIYIYIYVGSQIVAQTQVEKEDGPNKPNTINLLESGRKNWADKGSYNN